MNTNTENNRTENEGNEKSRCCTGKRRPKTKFHTLAMALGIATLLIVGIAAAAPGAAKHFFTPERIEAMIDNHVSEALDELKAEDWQRERIMEIKGELIAKFKDAHKDHFKDVDGMLSQWRSDNPDRDLVDSKVAAHLEKKKEMAAEVTDAVFDIHEILTPAQRNQLADMIESHMNEAHGCFGNK